MRSPEIIANSPKSGRANVEEGQHKSLSCSAIGNPMPIIRWRRADGKRMKYYDPATNGIKKSKYHSVKTEKTRNLLSLEKYFVNSSNTVFKYFITVS